MTGKTQLSWRKKLLFAMVPVLLVLLGVEIGLAFWSPPWLVFENHVPLIYEPHSTWGYRYTPDSRGVYRRYDEIDHEIRIGSHGWRGEPPVRPKPEGRFRILLLGDSHVAGLEVAAANTLGAALERALRDRAHALNFEVVSLGLDGIGTDVQRAILEDEGLALEPDLVLLQIFRNDFRDVGRPLVYRETVGSTVISYQTQEERAELVQEAERCESSWLRRIARISRLARAYRTWRLGKAPDNFLTSGEWFELQEDWDPLPERIDRVREEIFSMRALTESRGARFAVISLPASWILAKNRDPAAASYPVRHLGRWMREEGIPYLDLRAAILASGEDPANFFYVLDSHPNAPGYELMGGAIADWALQELEKEIERER